MTTSIEKTIVSFHVGRGGQFYNSGHVSFIGEKNISEFVDDLFLNPENTYEIFKKIGDRENLKSLYYNVLDGDLQAKAKFEARTGLSFGEAYYFDCNGTKIISEKEVNQGIGTIDIDGQYDTTYSQYLEDCNNDELELIANSTNYVSSDVMEYVKNKLS